jgi:hypothetical protein
MNIQQDRIYITRSGSRARVLGRMVHGGWRIRMTHAPYAEYIMCADGRFSTYGESTLDLMREATAIVLQFDQSKRKGTYSYEYFRNRKVREAKLRAAEERKENNAQVVRYMKGESL